jgi:steroid delta-isomerase-like uncharacterized protein
MDHTTDTKLLSRRFYEAYDRDDRQALADMLAPGCAIHMPGVPRPLGRETFLQVSALFADAFTDSVTTFEEQIAEGDTAVTRWVWRVTHRAPFQGIPATGKRVALAGVTIHRIAGGKIVEQWVSFDQLGLLEQIGAL